jgi:threonine aldolase
MRAIADLAKERGLKVHLDGARLWNAHVATGVSFADYAATADSVSVCFSKGLGAPVGSALAGSYEFVERARNNRKRFGGAMRQAGIIAAGAIYAIENNLERLVEDHQNAATLASYLLQVPGLTIHHPVQTNIVIADVGRLGGSDRVMEALGDSGVLCGVASPTRVRFVTHLDVSAEAVEAAGEIATRSLLTLVSGAQSG